MVVFFVGQRDYLGIWIRSNVLRNFRRVISQLNISHSLNMNNS